MQEKALSGRLSFDDLPQRRNKKCAGNPPKKCESFPVS